MILEYLALFFVFVLLFAFVVALVCLPVVIANARGICGSRKTAIIVLSLLGLFCGVTWFAALILALLWGSECGGCAGCATGDALDNLEKLAKLYKDKVISKSEYERMKAKLIQE